MKDLKLKVAVLKTLETASGNGMSTSTLREQVQLTCSPTPLATEINHVTSLLDAEGMVVGVRDSLDASVTVWTITDRGVAALRSRGM